MNPVYSCCCSAYRGVLEARFVYAVVVILFINALYNLYKTMSKLQTDQDDDKSLGAIAAVWSRFYLDLLLQWTLVCLLLVRTHNISLVAVVALQRACLGRALLEIKWMSSSQLTLLHVWLGQAAFFYQVSDVALLG